MEMSESESQRPQESGLEGGERDEAHQEGRGEGQTPESAAPTATGESGTGMPEQGAGTAKADSTPKIGTEDQGDQSLKASEGRGAE